MSENSIKAAEYVAEQVVNALGGFGLFGVELFVKVTRSSSAKFPSPTRYRNGDAHFSRAL